MLTQTIKWGYFGLLIINPCHNSLRHSMLKSEVFDEWEVSQ